MSEQVRVRAMCHRDLSAGMALKNLAGWNQLVVDWERFLEFEPHGCFLAELEGQVVGTATTISYPDLLGWIGMVLVHPEIRRRGVGKALMLACIQYLEGTGVRSIKLDATPMGKHLYDTLGFVDEYSLWRWQGSAEPVGPAGATVRALHPEDLETVVAFDRPVFGADRRRVLRRMLHEPTMRAAGAFSEAGTLLGYVAIRPGQNGAYLGPWIAVEGDVAGQLWNWAMRQAPSCRIFVDTPEQCGHALQILAQAGFERQREFIRMYRGENCSPGQPPMQCGLFGPEVG